MHRPRIAVDAEISGATAQVIGVSRAAHRGVARRLRQVELTVTGPYAAATSPTMRRSVALRQSDEATHRTARAGHGRSITERAAVCRVRGSPPERQPTCGAALRSCPLAPAYCELRSARLSSPAGSPDPSGAAAIALEPGTLTMRMHMRLRPMRSRATLALCPTRYPRLSALAGALHDLFTLTNS